MATLTVNGERRDVSVPGSHPVLFQNSTKGFKLHLGSND